jgi:hypothetical protein
LPNAIDPARICSSKNRKHTRANAERDYIC